jgi:DNA-binding beta-propeller fold protein YncE
MLDQYLADGRLAGYVRPGDSFILVSGKDAGEIDTVLLNSWAGILKEEYPNSSILAATSGTDNVSSGAPHLDPNLFAGLVADYEPDQENAPGFSWDISETVTIWRGMADEMEDAGLEAWGRPSGRSLPGFDHSGDWDYGILASIMGGLNVQTQSSCSNGNFDSALQYLVAQYQGNGATSDLFVEVSVDEGQSDTVSPEEALQCAELAWAFAEVDGIALWWSYPSVNLAEEFLILREKLLGADIPDSQTGDGPIPTPPLAPVPTVAPTPVPDNPPDEEPLEGPEGVAFYDGSPFTYVTNPRTDTVQVFNSGGALVNQWGGPGSGEGQFNNPSGIVINQDNGFVYIADTGNHRVQMFDTAGGFITQWGGPGEGEGQFNSPSGIAINPDSGFVYVADTGNNRVQAFNANGGFITQWGSSGRGNGELREPTGIAFNPLDGKVYVADTGNNRIQVFLSVGAYDSRWGRKGSERGRLLSPGGILVHPVSGSLYVADSGNHRIQVFDRLGEYLFEWGGEGGAQGQFRNPVELSADPGSGRIYIADSGNQRIQVFSQGGTFAFGWSP